MTPSRMLKLNSTALALSALATLASADPALDSLKSQVEGLSKTKVSGFLQARYEYGFDTSVIDPKASQLQGRFDIKRGRIIVSNDGSLGDFLVQVQYGEGGIQLIDAYASAYDPWKAARLRIGSQVLPFGYEVGSWGSSSMELLERSLFEQSVFTGEHDLGGVVCLNSKAGFLQYVDAKAGVFSGNMSVVGIPVLGSSANGLSQTDFDDGKAFAGRLGFVAPIAAAGVNLIGGVSGYYDVLTSEQDSVIDFAGQLSNTNAATHVSKGNFRNDLHKEIVGADLQATAKLFPIGSSILRGEVYGGTNVGLKSGAVFDAYSSSLPSSTAATVSTNKAYVRDVLGWNVVLVQNIFDFQVAGRFEQFDPNTDISGSQVGVLANSTYADLAWTQLSVAATYNLSANVKFTLEYDHKMNETAGVKSPAGAPDGRDYTTDVDNDKGTFQFQYKF